MSTNKLADNMLLGMQNYINGLPGATPAEKAENYNQQNGYRACFNKTEDFWNKVIEIDDDYTIPETGESVCIIIKSSGVTADPVIYLPSLSGNQGINILVINENSLYRAVIIKKSGSSDTIEGYDYIDLERSSHNNKIQLKAVPSEWKRIAREFVLVPESLRPNGYVLNGGVATTWTDVSFNTWVQDGAYTVLLQYIILHRGNNVYDYAIFSMRPKGSSIDNFFQNTFVVAWWTNLTTGFTLGNGGHIAVKCDFNGIIQYKQISGAESGNGQLFLTIAGYWK